MKAFYYLEIALVMISPVEVFSDEDYMTIEPSDNGKALINPRMGWTLRFYSNITTNYGSRLAPSDTLDDFPGLDLQCACDSFGCLLKMNGKGRGDEKLAR